MKSVLTTAAVLIFIATPPPVQVPSGRRWTHTRRDIPVLRHLGRYIIPRIDRGALRRARHTMAHMPSHRAIIATTPIILGLGHGA